MKKSVFAVSLILLAFFLQTCREEEPLSKGNVQFAFRTSSPNNSGGRSLSELPEGSVLHFSIVTSTYSEGNSFDDITILKFGDQYITEPVPLATGDYFVDGFYIITPDHEIVYAAPMADSPLASLVEHPLPLAFTVTEEDITTLDIEVVSTDAHSPSDFGYASFGIEVVESEVFEVSVFTTGENGTLIPTGAQAYLLHGEDTIYRSRLQPGANKIVFDAAYNDTYTLALIEPSCKKYSRTFVLSALLFELNNNPLSINLAPAITFTTSYSATPFIFNKYMLFGTGNNSTYAHLTIDWGDGTLEEVEIPSDGPYPSEHFYAHPNSYFVSIYGDLNLLTHFQLHYGDGITDISIKHLPNLITFGLGGLGGSVTPATVDLSHNPKLMRLDLSQGTCKTIDISNNVFLNNIDLFLVSSFETESLNKMIHDLHEHVVANNIRMGGLNLGKDWSGNIIGPPSEAAKVELRDLHDNYNWNIAPENF